jgi:hypothetical protein
MSAWFGKHWGAPICDDTPHAVTPVGMACGFCDEPIAAGDDGVLIPSLGGDGQHRVAFHYECNLRSVIGGVNHQLGICTCCGGSLPPDDPRFSKREAARNAVRFWQTNRNVGRLL